MCVLVLVSWTDANVPIIDSFNVGRPRYILKPRQPPGDKAPSTVKFKVHRTVKIRMDAAAPKGGKRYQPKARILVDRDERECPIETCADSFRELIGFPRWEGKHKWTDVKPSAWSWVD